jgi:hypothetical protein
VSSILNRCAVGKQGYVDHCRRCRRQCCVVLTRCCLSFFSCAPNLDPNLDLNKTSQDTLQLCICDAIHNNNHSGSFHPLPCAYHRVAEIATPTRPHWPCASLPLARSLPLQAPPGHASGSRGRRRDHKHNTRTPCLCLAFHKPDCTTFLHLHLPPTTALSCDTFWIGRLELQALLPRHTTFAKTDGTKRHKNRQDGALKCPRKQWQHHSRSAVRPPIPPPINH